jgi:gliding motility-associated-like protein
VSQSGQYWVQGLINNCPFSDTFNITLGGFPAIDIGPDTSLCGNFTLSLDAGPGLAGYLWSDGSTQQTATFTSPGWTWVAVTDSNGCSNRDSLLISPGSLPNLQLGPDTTLCEGETVLLAPQLSGSGYDFLWSNGAATPAISVSQAGIYWVEATQQASGCSGRDSVLINFLQNPDPVLPPDTLVCDSNRIVLFPGTFDSYLWSDGSTDSILTVTLPGDYSVSVSNGGICTDSALIHIEFGNYPSPDLGPDLDLCLEDPRILFLSPEPDATVRWSNGSTDWSMEFTQTGDYWAEVTNECGTVRDSIRVDYAREFQEPFIPNVFSPNGDGVIDCYRVENPRSQSFMMQIFDRWGRLMYETRNINDCWNGTYRGKPAPAGVFVVMVHLEACNGATVTKSGTVTLVR